MLTFYVNSISSGDKKRQPIFLSFKETLKKVKENLSLLTGPVISVRNRSLIGSTDILYIYTPWL